ncbi:hypothetical protein SKB0092_31170 [Roseomonas mucosa]
MKTAPWASVNHERGFGTTLRHGSHRNARVTQKRVCALPRQEAAGVKGGRIAPSWQGAATESGAERQAAQAGQ